MPKCRSMKTPIRATLLNALTAAPNWRWLDSTRLNSTWRLKRKRKIGPSRLLFVAKPPRLRALLQWSALSRGDLFAFIHNLAGFSARPSAGHNEGFSSVADHVAATLNVHRSVEARHANVVLCKNQGM